MRSNYNILWLDDDFDNDTAFLMGLVKKVENYLKLKSYIPKIIKVSNKKIALEKINSNEKIDLFLSDYNISTDDEFSGFDFLVATRKNYKQEMLLYSNQDEQQLKDHIIDYLKKDSTPLEYFSKFIFQSTINRTLLVDSITSIIDLTLIRWDELNALRGLYLSETSQVHYDAKKYIREKIPSAELVNNFDNNYPSNPRMAKRRRNVIKVLNGTDNYSEELFDFFEVQCVLSNTTNNLYSIWDDIRKIRNGCAHVKQSQNNGGENFITLMDNSTVIKESEIDKYRKKLLDFVNKYNEAYPPDDDINIVDFDLNDIMEIK